MKPSLATRRIAADLGLCKSKSDDEIETALKGAKVTKAQRKLFIDWLRKKYGYVI